MRSMVLRVVLVLLVAGVVLGSATALASPTHDAPNLTTTRSTYTEWIVQETEAGLVRVPVTVHRVTVVETVIVPRAEP